MMLAANVHASGNPPTLAGGSDLETPPRQDAKWFVAHTLPRREKKLKACADREGLESILPTYKSVRKYRGKTLHFFKPLFPGYLFFKARPELMQKVRQSDHVARLLDVSDQALFEKQLGEILFALQSGVEILLAPEIGAGTRVRIKNGPLQGLEAWVEQRSGANIVLLRLDFIGQAAAVSLPADSLEPC